MKVCPICGSHHLIEIIDGATVVRALFIRNEDDWEIDEEEIETDEATLSYSCRQCDYRYEGGFIIDVIEKEMIEEEG
jgi:hypothetical protein